jgi:hypothetical protein
MSWLRWWAGTVNDPKWRIIAARANCRPGDCLAVWAYLLEIAKDGDGDISKADTEECAVVLGYDHLLVETIIVAMRDKELIADGRLTAWEKRQPKREDGSAERAKAWREHKKTENKETERARTQPNATESDTDTDTDTEKKETTRAVRADAPSGFIEFWAHYPNRIGRGAAVRAFVKARSKADQVTIMAGLARYAAKQDDRPWCNPATWLNQERWLDAPAAQGPPRAAAQQPVKEHRNADFIRNLAKIHQRDPSNPANHSRPTDAAPAASDAGLPDSGVDRTIELDASYAEWRRS